MSEIYVDQKAIESHAMFQVQRLKEIAQRHERKYPVMIQAVFVFSGPGTYYDKLKPAQEEHLRWMDRDRIRAGVAVVREVTATKLSKSLSKRQKANAATIGEILNKGPFLVYNGTPLENEVFRRAMDSDTSKLPKAKIVVIDNVLEEDGSTHPIRHTGEKYKSFFQEISNPESPIYDIRRVALVAHNTDFIRHPYYADLYNNRRIAEGKLPVQFWAYGIKNRSGTEQPNLEEEISKLVPYAKKGDLSTDPAHLFT